jgi:tetratricopeptide (TPR) repeat protein
MKLDIKSRIALALPLAALGAALSNISAIANNYYLSNGTTIAEQPRQLAYLTPSITMDRMRDLATEQYKVMNFTAAVQQYNQICQYAGASDKDFYWLGESYYHLNKFGEAATAFDRAVVANPTSDDLRIRQVESYLAAGQNEVARQKCTEALSLAKDSQSRHVLTVLIDRCDKRQIAPRKMMNLGPRGLRQTERAR